MSLDLNAIRELTDAEWRAFQAIPEQGYSHRAWVDARIAERTAELQARLDKVRGLLPAFYSSFDDTYAIPATMLQAALRGDDHE